MLNYQRVLSIWGQQYHLKWYSSALTISRSGKSSSRYIFGVSNFGSHGKNLTTTALIRCWLRFASWLLLVSTIVVENAVYTANVNCDNSVGSAFLTIPLLAPQVPDPLPHHSGAVGGGRIVGGSSDLL